MERFDECCYTILQTAERLLNRYPKLRYRSGDSVAGRILYPCLTVMKGAESFFPSQNAPVFWQLSDALIACHNRLRRRRIPPCSDLMLLRKQCHTLIRTLTNVPSNWDSPSVLVGTLRNVEQLDICLECGFYHIPAGLVPSDRLPIDYVAIYQSRTKFPEDCGIQIYGKVKSCTPVRRWQVREIPKDSDELYYRLEVERWRYLKVPIAVLEIPFTHLYTNLFLLTHSLETPELTLKSPTHHLLYQAIRRGIELGDGTVFRHPGGTVRIRNGLILIHRRRRKLAAFVANDFEQTPADIFNQMISILEKNH